MKEKRTSPRGRFVRRHPRKLPKRPGEFAVIGPYQEEVDRLSTKPSPKLDPQLKLELLPPVVVKQLDDEELNPSARN